MTDHRRLELERLFDGEIAEADRARLLAGVSADPEAVAYLRRLEKLRALAGRHDPASRIPRRSRSYSTPPRRARWGWAALATAAGIALLVATRDRGPRPDGLVPTPSKSSGMVASGSGRLARPVDVPPFEVSFYGWANTKARHAQQAARLVLAPAGASRKRSLADEILALELANAGPGVGADLRRIAANRAPRSSAPASTSARPAPASPRGPTSDRRA